MNPDSDYSFSEPVAETADAPFGLSLHIPFALLTSAIAVIMVTQTIATFKQKSALQAAQVQNADDLKKREVVVKQSTDLETKFSDLFMDLLILGKTDEDAKQIIAKHGIQQSGQPGQPASTPAP
jgi:hypothetical protein